MNFKEFFFRQFWEFLGSATDFKKIQVKSKKLWYSYTVLLYFTVRSLTILCVGQRGVKLCTVLASVKFSCNIFRLYAVLVSAKSDSMLCHIARSHLYPNYLYETKIFCETILV